MISHDRVYITSHKKTRQPVECVRASCFTYKPLPVSWEFISHDVDSPNCKKVRVWPLAGNSLTLFSFIFIGSSWEVRCGVFSGIDGHSYTSDSHLGRWASRYCTWCRRCDPRRSCATQLVSVCVMWQWQDAGTTLQLFTAFFTTFALFKELEKFKVLKFFYLSECLRKGGETAWFMAKNLITVELKKECKGYK